MAKSSSTIPHKEKFISRYLEEEMKESYLSYAMSVIVGRAIPDIRDGLKPVQRRILYTMQGLHLKHNQPFKKCARVVGECLGKYHPHGDMAVYDALVRMAQDFSLRYPLVEGQGNFGCFTADTKIRLCDGRSITFKELVKEHKQGKRHFTFTYNHSTRKIEIAEIKNPRLTRKDEKILKIILDNGKEIKCTYDHLFMLRDGSYKKAKDLKPQDSLMPLYIKLDDGKKNIHLKGYELIHQPQYQQWEYTHHLADEWNIKNKIYSKRAGKVRHHLDFNKYNNNPTNIIRIPWAKHWDFHKEIAKQRHLDPKYREKLKEGRERFWAKVENRQKYADLLKKRNKIMWKDEKYRKKQIEAIRKKWQNLLYKEYMREVARRNIKHLWKKAEFKTFISDLKSRECKRKWQDEGYRKKMTKLMREVSLSIWSDPAHREHISTLMKIKFKDEKLKKQQRQIAKQLWRNPDYRAKFSSSHFREMAKRLWSNPQTRELHRRKALLQWQNPFFREKALKAARAGLTAYLKTHPDFMKELTEKAKISLRKKWQDSSYKDKVIKSKILNFVSSLKKKYLKITPQVYEKERRNNGVPRIEKALFYFDSFEDILNRAEVYNHKVERIEFLSQREDVYDLTIEPWHNFSLAAGVFVHNSLDGDPPAAQRYTECRLSEIAEYLLEDIDKDTVNFFPNFDNSLQEPEVLPTLVPNLLINGCSGIAVGMATNIPPHNLAEVAEAIIYLIDHPQASIKDIIRFIKGPDFPTGGIICGRKSILQMYKEGKGKLTLRAKATIEHTKNKEKIIITEIPYQLNKSNLIESIAQLINNKKIEGVSDLRDESDKDGVRIVLDLKRDAQPRIILNQLYKHTNLETTYGAIFLAILNNKPQILNLKEFLNHHISFRKTIIVRRSKFELEKAKKRAHILEGLKKALKNLDKIVELIKKSQNPQEAKSGLIKKFSFTDIQAQAILEMQLQRLCALERKKIDEEYLALIKQIEYLNLILSSEKKQEEIIKQEIGEIKKKFSDSRRTEIVPQKEELDIEDLIVDEEVAITITHKGYIKKQPASSYRQQQRGGRGVRAITTSEEDFVEHIFVASSKDTLLIFTSEGKVYPLKAYEVPEGSRTSRGRAIVNLLNLNKQEKITTTLSVKDFKETEYLFFATEKGLVKRTSLSLYANIRKNGIYCINLTKGDKLISAAIISDKDSIFLGTRDGLSIKFKANQIRPSGRQSQGVRGIRLKKDDVVLGMCVIPFSLKEQNLYILTITEKGFAKRTKVSQYRLQSRGGMGIGNIKLSARIGKVENLLLVGDNDEIMCITQKGILIRIKTADIRISGRLSQGVKIIRLDPADKVSAATPVVGE